MPNFAANLTMMFQEIDFLDRFKAASRAGFKGVEYLFPYDFEVNLLVDQLKKHDLIQVLHNLPAGNWQAGERGIAIMPDRVGEFQEGVGKGIEYANALECKQLNILAGVASENSDPEKLQRTFVDNLKFAADELAAQGINLVIEAINTQDIPGFFLCNTQQALDAIAATGSSNIKIQYDIYHMQIMEGNLAATIKSHLTKHRSYSVGRQSRTS